MNFHSTREIASIQSHGEGTGVNTVNLHQNPPLQDMLKLNGDVSIDI